jgi:anti-sigma-K factor RskA
MAMSTTLDRREIEELLPWYAAGTLSPAERRQVEAALAADPELAALLAITHEEMGEAVLDTEQLATPSPKALDKLMAKIEAEPARRRSGLAAFDIGEQLAAWLSPRTLGWAAAAATLLVVAQAGLITARLLPGSPAQYTTASAPEAAAAGRFVIVGFQPGATAEAIARTLEGAGASIVDGPRPGGLYRLRIGAADMAAAEADKAIAALKAQTQTVRLVLPAE